MTILKAFAGFLLLMLAVVFSETHITGDITGMTFESGGNPFIIEQDILIPSGSKAVIKQGCVFLFKPFTGLTVHGHLSVEGTQELPVTFSSVNDGEYNQESEQLPNPFDWNGILISREAGMVTMHNFILRFSVYGIKSQNTTIVLENGLFQQNGQFHFTINDKIQFVQDKIPFSYNGTDAQEPTGKPPKVVIRDPVGKKSISSTKKMVRYTSLGIGTFGVVGGIILGVEANRRQTVWFNHSTEYEKYKRQYYDCVTWAVVSGVIGGLGLTSFGLTFVF